MNSNDSPRVQQHDAVLLVEAVEALMQGTDSQSVDENNQANGIFIDCTFGRGGHSRKLLSRLGKKSKLLAVSSASTVGGGVPTSA